MELCPRSLELGLDKFCTLTEWEEMRGCRHESNNKVPSSGWRPSQLINLQDLCDGSFDAIDRSDEENCDAYDYVNAKDTMIFDAETW